jgi:hypothetical protein
VLLMSWLRQWATEQAGLLRAGTAAELQEELRAEVAADPVRRGHPAWEQFTQAFRETPG